MAKKKIFLKWHTEHFKQWFDEIRKEAKEFDKTAEKLAAAVSAKKLFGIEAEEFRHTTPDAVFGRLGQGRN